MKKVLSISVITILSLATLFAQKQNKSEKAQTTEKQVPTEQTEKVEGPEIQFEKQVHNYGNIEYAANGDCEFIFTNIGTEPLILSNVQSSCGCTTPSWPREPIMPGQKSSIKVHYDTTRSGSISKAITVTTNGKTDRIVLRISGNVGAKPQS